MSTVTYHLCITVLGEPIILPRAWYWVGVNAWVLHPSKPSITLGDPLKVTTTASHADFWTMMVTGTGDIPLRSLAKAPFAEAESIPHFNSTTVLFKALQESASLLEQIQKNDSHSRKE